MTPSRSHETLSLRPSRDTYKKTVASVPIFIVAIAAIGIMRNPAAALITAAIVFPIGAVGMLLYFRAARITVADGTVSRTTLTGRRRTYPVTELGEVVFVPELSSGDGRYFPNLFAFDRTGRRVLRMTGTVWAAEDMERLAEAIGREPSVYQGPMRAKDLRTRHPTAVNVFEARPILVGLLAGLAIVVIAAVAVAIVMTT